MLNLATVFSWDDAVGHEAPGPAIWEDGNRKKSGAAPPTFVLLGGPPGVSRRWTCPALFLRYGPSEPVARS